MTSTVPSVVWLQWLALLAAEVGVIALVVAAAQRHVKSPAWRRTLWQAATVSVLGIASCEFSGAAREVAAWISNSVAQNRPNGITGPAIVGLSGRAVARGAATDNKIGAIPVKHSEALVASERATPGVSQGPNPATLEHAPRISAPGSSGKAAASDIGFITWLALLWFGGSVLVAGRVCLAHFCLALLRRRPGNVTDKLFLRRFNTLASTLTVGPRVRAIQSARLKGPIAFGVIRSTVALPMGFSTRFDEAKQDAMLLHELAHLAARDPFWYLLADLSTIVLWWHPLVWWLRRQLHVASESAADEASLLVADGPRVLAECLLELGTRLAAPRFLRGLGVSGLRSNLGRRVHRLVHLEDRQWRPPDRLRAGLLRGAGPVAIVAGVILCSAWVAPKALTKGDGMKTVQQNWKRSLATIALLAAFNSTDANSAPATPAGPAAPAASRDIHGRAATAPVNAATPGGPETPEGQWRKATNQFNAYVAQAVSGQAAVRAKPREVATPNPELEARLKGIVLDQAFYDGIPLSEVLRSLNVESQKQDPKKQGISFLLNRNPMPGFIAPPTIDPNTGLPVPSSPIESMDLASVTITFLTPLRHVTMKDVLDAIVQTADYPIQYSVEDYGVVFSLAPKPYLPPQPAVTMTACTFKVNTNTFLAGLNSAFGIKVKLPPGEAQGAERSRKIQDALMNLFSQLGISTEGNKSVYYNELTGIVMVRVTSSDFPIVQAAMHTLGGALYPAVAFSNPSLSPGGQAVTGDSGKQPGQQPAP